MSCPVCGKESLATWRPFCSRRCADIDLGKWLNGSYTVPMAEPDDGEPASGEEPVERVRRH